MIVIRHKDSGALREALADYPDFFLGYEPSVQGQVSGMFPVVLFLRKQWEEVNTTGPKKIGKS